MAPPAGAANMSVGLHLRDLVDRVPALEIHADLLAAVGDGDPAVEPALAAGVVVTVSECGRDSWVTTRHRSAESAQRSTPGTRRPGCPLRCSRRHRERRRATAARSEPGGVSGDKVAGSRPARGVVRPARPAGVGRRCCADPRCVGDDHLERLGHDELFLQPGDLIGAEHRLAGLIGVRGRGPAGVADVGHDEPHPARSPTTGTGRALGRSGREAARRKEMLPGRPAGSPRSTCCRSHRRRWWNRGRCGTNNPTPSEVRGALPRQYMDWYSTWPSCPVTVVSTGSA